MTKSDTQHFKDKLLKEKALLEEELASVAKVNPDNPADWQATSGNIETDSADENETADKFEELEENEIILNKIEPHYREIKAALERIDAGKYGICETCNNPIEKDRLEANPSARTCIAHMNTK